jgi:ABC-type antimicrobial peptide transport system permease subunit
LLRRSLGAFWNALLLQPRRLEDEMLHDIRFGARMYGVISYTVARRTGEIGIRLALGATPAGVRRLILKESSWPVLAGIALGVPAALAVTRLISSRLFGVSPRDPFTIAVAVSLVLIFAAAAAFLPAHRASSSDPMIAIRHE